MAELPVNNQIANDFIEDDDNDDLFVSAIGVSFFYLHFLFNSTIEFY